MGNSASNANNPPRNNNPTAATVRPTSTSPGPGNPHRSLRTKKRSLELPDLASLTLSAPPQQNHSSSRGRQSKSASIPIPATPQSPFNHYQHAQAVQPQRAPLHLPSTTDVLAEAPLQPPSTHQPFPHPPPPSSRSRGNQQQQQQGQRQQSYQQQQQYTQSAPRGRQQPISARQQQQVMRIQELYDRSQQQHPAAPPSSPAASLSVSSPLRSPNQRPQFVKEVVRSSIPVLLGKGNLSADAGVDVGEANLSPVREDLLADPVPVKIVWKGGGEEVVLARAGDDEWKGRQPMERESPTSNVWTLTVYLQPGTHHVRFLVDGQWRVADDLPAAVDDQGSLANYVAVPLTYGIPGAPAAGTQVSSPPSTAAAAAPPKKVIPGQSFWSADSSADGETEDAHTTTTTTTSSSKTATQSPGGADSTSTSTSTTTNKHAHMTAAAVAYTQASWTSVLPPELLEAAREEEAYLAASAGQYDSPTGNTRVMGFVPAPNIPPAPGLPRHLDKLILNSRVGSSGAGRRQRREEHEESERQRASASAPSETGDFEPEPEAPPAKPVTSPYMPAALLNLHNQPISSAAAVEATLAGSGSTCITGGGTSSSLPTAGSSSGPGGPHASTLASSSGGALSTSGGGVSSSGVAAALAANSNSNSNSSGVESTATSGTGGGDSRTTTAATSPQGSLPATPTGPLSPHQTPPKSGAVWGVVGAGPGVGAAGGLGTMSPSASSPSAPGGRQQAQASAQQQALQQSPTMLDRAISGSRAITIDDANMPPLTDDNSVLPVPSHVVLHHLCTSAIRNGVLAVANTTRYRKKYLTTIYYKPT
ncbi:hypothetical protein BDZ97DRAFT_1925406 [Flammula alnicola]|nr:hypothetical protein BDZ97DRAFT_1925406 [Flammula alnicola]